MAQLTMHTLLADAAKDLPVGDTIELVVNAEVSVAIYRRTKTRYDVWGPRIGRSGGKGRAILYGARQDAVIKNRTVTAAVSAAVTWFAEAHEAVVAREEEVRDAA
jgi:hypothetical protein